MRSVVAGQQTNCSARARNQGKWMRFRKTLPLHHFTPGHPLHLDPPGSCLRGHLLESGSDGGNSPGSPCRPNFCTDEAQQPTYSSNISMKYHADNASIMVRTSDLNVQEKHTSVHHARSSAHTGYLPNPATQHLPCSVCPSASNLHSYYGNHSLSLTRP